MYKCIMYKCKMYKCIMYKCIKEKCIMYKCIMFKSSNLQRYNVCCIDVKLYKCNNCRVVCIQTYNMQFNFKPICLKDHGSRTNGLKDIQVRNQCARKSHAYIAEVYTFISTPLYMRGFCGHTNFKLEYLLNRWSQLNKI